jgi:hypothetical protein
MVIKMIMKICNIQDKSEMTLKYNYYNNIKIV